MKLVIFQEKIPHYRIELFNEIASQQEVDLTLIHTKGFVDEDKIKFSTIKIPVKKFGVILSRNLLSSGRHLLLFWS